MSAESQPSPKVMVPDIRSEEADYYFLEVGPQDLPPFDAGNVSPKELRRLIAERKKIRVLYEQNGWPLPFVPGIDDAPEPV